MKSMKLLTAAAVVTGLMATPALARDKTKHRTTTQSDYNMQMSDSGYRDSGYRSDMRRTDSGFWPADVAAGAVGGAVGVAGAAVNTAGAIATAPFRAWDDNSPWDNSRPWDNRRANVQSGTWNNSYAYYDGPVDRVDPRDSYARRNNFVCQPGTWIRGGDGRRHLCQ
jgi:hypothetical protein